MWPARTALQGAPRRPGSPTNLAATDRTEGRAAEALELYERALAIREKALGPGPPGVGEGLNNLGLVQKDLGRFEESERLHRRALAIFQKSLGEGHVRVASSLNNL